MSPRMRALRRTLFAGAALFAALLTFLSLQMLRGRDPSLRAGTQARVAQPAPRTEREGGDSLISSIVGFATSVISEGDDGGSSSSPSVRTQTS